MNSEEFEEFLEARRSSMSEHEFFALILDMLDKDPSEESRDILRAWLTSFSDVDPDSVARYWEPFLSDPDPFWREAAALRLSTMLYEPNSLTDKILSKHLGIEIGTTTAEEQLDMIMGRMKALFPSQDDEGNQNHD